MGAGDSIPVINVRTILYTKRELMHRDLKLRQEKKWEKGSPQLLFFFGSCWRRNFILSTSYRCTVSVFIFLICRCLQVFDAHPPTICFSPTLYPDRRDSDTQFFFFSLKLFITFAFFLLQSWLIAFFLLVPSEHKAERVGYHFNPSDR